MGIISDISRDVSIERRTKSTLFTLPLARVTIDNEPSLMVTHIDVDNTLLPALLEATWQAYSKRRDRAPYPGPERRTASPKKID